VHYKSLDDGDRMMIWPCCDVLYRAQVAQQVCSVASL